MNPAVNHPSIYQTGTVDDDGTTVTVTGWGLGLCQAGCVCHRHPANGHLYIAEDQVTGALGLRSFVDGCGCCQPWTAEELAAVLRDLADVAALETA